MGVPLFLSPSRDAYDIFYYISAMRKYIVILLCVLSALFLFSCKGSKTRPDGTPKEASIKLDSTSANLGTFPKSASTRTAVFTFTNVGDDKLEFYDVDYSCGCVKATYPDKPVKPGKSGEIVVTYKGINKKPGNVYQKVYFACSGKPSNFVLRVKGVMTEK